MKLYFYGGAKSVTGANYMIECAGTKILIDCGLYQGSRFVEKQNYDSFPYDPKEIKAILLTHAHADHVGRVPKLYRDGFRGDIYGSYPTLDLARLNLDDSLHILEDEARRYKDEPIFSKEDINGCWKSTHGKPYHKEIEITPNIKFRLNDAGHILGSSIIELFLSENGKNVKIVFSGDLGNPPTPLLKPTEFIKDADYILVESAYGDRIHEDRALRKNKLEEVIESVIKNGGVLMIPSFALERTQELLFELNNLVESGSIPRVRMFMDSPLAIKATAVYQKYSDYFNSDAVYLIKSGDDLFNFPGLEFSLTAESSKAINNIAPPKIIIAGSGMSEGGRIIHHEKRYLPDPKSTLLIIGYQTSNTLGRRLLDGADEVKIMGEDVIVRAQVKAISGYSAHADQAILLDWIKHFSGVKKVFVTQGEAGPASILALKIKDHLNFSAEVPEYGEVVELD
jgi:metallo-beta-lactamase family protein